MRGFNVIRHVLALLSQLFFITVLGLGFWTGVIVLATGWTPTIVMSGSMEPAIKTGYILIADPMPADEIRTVIKKGHVLLADDPARPGTMVTHRVIRFDEAKDSFITRGDANKNNDSTPVPVANVHGMERLAVPYIGIPYQAAKNGNFIPLVAFTLLLLISVFMVKHEWKVVLAEEKAKSPSAPALTRKEQKARKKQQALASVILLALVAGVALGGSFAFSTSFAAFKGTTKNTASTFVAKAVFPAPAPGCWASGVTTGNFNVTMTQTSAFGTPATWNTTVNVSLKPDKTGYTYGMPTGPALAPSATIGLSMDNRSTNQAGIVRTTTTGFSSEGYTSGVINTLDMNSTPVAVHLRIYKNNAKGGYIEYWGTDFVISRC